MEGMAGSAGSGRASIPEYIPKPGAVNRPRDKRYEDLLVQRLSAGSQSLAEVNVSRP